jgi:DNA primase
MMIMSFFKRILTGFYKNGGFMPRIPTDRLNRIKKDVSLLDWIESEGLVLKKQGKDYVMACVFHEDKTPSLKITPTKNLYHCFGCGAAGSVIDWVMARQGVEFRAAVEVIEQRQGWSDQEASAPVATVNIAPDAVSSLAAALSECDQAVALQGVVDYYHQCLLNSPEALAYLDSRGLHDMALITRFKLGVSDKTLTSTLAAKHTQTGKQQRQCLQEIGILKKTGYEHFASCLVVPIMSADGEIQNLYGRRIQKYSKPKHLYLPRPHLGIINAEGLAGTNTLILCEALIDAMTFWVHGFKNVTASYGTNGFTGDHLELIKRNEISTVLIAYDRDEAGNTAAQTVAEQLTADNINCYRVNFPKGMDANEVAVTMTPAAKVLALALEKAEPLCGAPMLEQRLSEGEQKTGNSQQQTQQNETEPENHVVINTPIKIASKALTGELIVADGEVSLVCGARVYRVRGLDKNTRSDQLKINCLVRVADASYVDQFDLYQAKLRKQFIASAADELGIDVAVIKKDVGQLLLALEEYQENHQQQAASKQTQEKKLTAEEQQQGLALLQDKKLIQRITQDINTLGVIGEDSNVLVSYLACVSRKLDKPLAVMIQSTSAAGKSALMDSVLSLMPDDHQHKFAAMTGQSLYYMGEMDLKHSILAIAEEEGAHTASYALKLLQSEGEVSIASTGKNEDTGDLETKTYQVEGPVMLMMTTTAIDIDEELMNRCLVLSVNESREQTQAIHAMQRQKRTLAGLTQKIKKQTVVEQHHAAQALLKPLAVINPYAEHLTFLSDKTRTRRDHEKYLTLIDSIALLHQFQREIKTLPAESNSDVVEYIEVTLDDIELANQLAHEVLGRSLDELPPQTRKLLDLISEMVTLACEQESMAQSDYRFSRKQIRDVTGWGNTQIRIHCDRLVDMEYLVVHRGQRGTSFVYELLYQVPNESNDRILMNLIDTNTLKNCHSSNSSRGSIPLLAGSKRPQNGGLTASKRGNKNPAIPEPAGINGKTTQKTSKMHVLETSPLVQSYGSIEKRAEERAEEVAEIVGGAAG